MIRSLRALTVCAAVLVLAGCTVTVEGKPVPNLAAVRQAEEERTPLTASVAFGDLTTIDYCSLLDLQALQDAGVSDPDEPSSSYDDCGVDGQFQGQGVRVELGYLEAEPQDGLTPDPTKKLPRGLVAKRAPDTDGGCRYYLSFPDGFDLGVYSYYTDTGQADQNLCDIDFALFDGVVTVATRKQVKHLSFAPGSLGTIDACALIPDSLVDDQTGVPLPRSFSPSKHHCWWIARDGSLTTALLFYTYSLPPATFPATAETIGNHSSVVIPVSPSYCVIDTAVGPPPVASDGEVSIAEIYVIDNAGGKDTCGIARALANQAWSRLPAS